MNGQVFNLPVHPGENSTYNLRFRGPQFRCTSLPDYNNTIPLDYYGPDSLITPTFVSKWDRESRWNLDLQDVPLYSIAKHVLRTWTTQRTSKNVTSFEGFRTSAEQICKPLSVLYDVNISYPRGIQTVQYTRSDMKMLSLMRDYYKIGYRIDSDLGYTGFYLRLPADAQALQDWNHRMRILLPLATEWALLDALGEVLEDTIYERCDYCGNVTPNMWCEESSVSTNGTTCGIWSRNPGYLPMNTSCRSACLACSDCRN
jgi:hypothetical protein